MISGGGGLTQAGAGLLTLTGNNTYTGPTTISAGTLQLGNGGAAGSLSSSSSVTDNGVLVFNHSNSITQGSSAAITGSGSLVQAGSGTLYLTSTNNAYMGGTVLSAGTLDFVADALPTGSNAITFNGGALQWAPGNIQDVSASIAPSALFSGDDRHRHEQRQFRRRASAAAARAGWSSWAAARSPWPPRTPTAARPISKPERWSSPAPPPCQARSPSAGSGSTLALTGGTNAGEFGVTAISQLLASLQSS